MIKTKKRWAYPLEEQNNIKILKMLKFKQVSLLDIFEYLQKNNALLNTLLWFLEQQSENPLLAQQKSKEQFNKYLQHGQFQFQQKSKYNQKKKEREIENEYSKNTLYSELLQLN